MSSLRKTQRVHLDTKSGFGNLVDIFNNIMFFQIIYCFMLTIYYNQYQNSKSEFQPIIYFSIMILVVFITIFEAFFVEIWKLALSEALVSLALIIIAPIHGNKLIFSLACVVLCVKSLYSHRFRFSQSATYSQRYRSQNRNWVYITAMLILFFVHIFSSDDVSLEEKISPIVCNYYMLASFAIFIISIIMNKYAFKFYEYYRQEKDNTKINKQLSRSFVLILFTTIILITIVFILFGNLLVPLLNTIKNLILKILLSILWGIFNIDLAGDRESKNTQMHSLNTGGSAQAKEIKSNGGYFTEIMPMLVILIIIAAVLYLIWKIYKGILANYKVGSDEVEFIPMKEKTIYYEESGKISNKVSFGKTNSDKIRKHYYQSVRRKMKKYNINLAGVETSDEIYKKTAYNEEEKKSMLKLTEIYKKARYSNIEISEKEVDEAKNINV